MTKSEFEPKLAAERKTDPKSALNASDSTSVATEYSLKFDSMTEDEMEEKSFRSLLPSESHRRISLKKRSHRGYSDQEAASRKMPLSSVKASIQYFVPSYVWDSSG
ncbi:UNVERIFIED_CONTAM: hypothetical protein K2H54_001312 [Gekko kuhli]